MLRQKSQKLTYHQTSGVVSPSPSATLQATTYELESSPWVVDHIETRLEKNPTYLEIKDSEGQTMDRRQIGQVDLNKSTFKLAITSCMNDRFDKEQEQIWKDLAKDRPEYLFMIGDNVYATTILGPLEKSVDKSRLWDRYVQTRRSLAVFYLDELIPTLAQWDDHDYGTNDGDKTNPYRREAMEVFEAFYPQKAVKGIFTRGPANSFVFDAFQARFYFLDNRSEREPNGSDPGKYAHFGEKQETWLFQSLKSRSIPSWLFMGDQFFGGYHRFESFEGNHAKSFKHFMGILQGIRQPVVFVSGDRHLTEISKIGPPDLGYETYELTSSPVHAKTHPSGWEVRPNRRQLVGADLKINYMIVEGSHSTRSLAMKVTAKSKLQEILFSKDLLIKRSN
ncbi:MAG: alkaline phosphatase D family protein [Bdellovibrionales bacterium]|nr:alkaline phosphatase D family protein [Bdellovibrionales bacterium]